MKRILLLVLAFTMVLSLCAYVPAALAADVQPFVWLLPGNEPEDNAMVLAEINKRMQEDGVALELKTVFIPWDVWDERLNVMLATGEEFDAFHVMQDRVKISTYYGREALAPVTQYMEEFGQNIKAVIPDDILALGQIHGEIFGVPVMFRDFAYTDEPIGCQVQYWEELGLDFPPKDLDQLFEQMTQIAAAYPDENFWVPTRVNQLSNTALQRSFDSYPFVTIEDLFLVDQNCAASAYLYTDEFKQTADVFRWLYQNNFIHPDLLTMPVTQRNNMVADGQWAFNFKHVLTDAAKIKVNKPDAKLDEIVFKPEEPRFRGIRVVNNYNVASSTSDDPSKLIKFFNWVYAKQENLDLLLLGIEGVHWEETGPREYRIIGAEAPKYNLGDGYLLSNYNFARMRQTDDPRLASYWLAFDSDAVNSVAAGFNFDPTPVLTEYQNCLAEVEANVYPIKYGLLPMEGNYDAMISRMKTAGYDAVVAEFQKQFEAYAVEAGLK